MTTSCTVTVVALLLMGGVTTSILFFFCCGKFVPPIFESPARKRDCFFLRIAP